MSAQKLTYDLVALRRDKPVQAVQLRLTLVELVEVSHLQRDASMGLVYLNGQVVLDALHGHVLANRPQLVVYVTVCGGLLLPLFHHKFQCLPQDALGPHVHRVWRRDESIVGLLKSLAGAFDDEFSPVSDDVRTLARLLRFLDEAAIFALRLLEKAVIAFQIITSKGVKSLLTKQVLQVLLWWLLLLRLLLLTTNLLHTLHNTLVVLQKIGVDLRIRHRTLPDKTGLGDRGPVAGKENAALAAPLEQSRQLDHHELPLVGGEALGESTLHVATQGLGVHFLDPKQIDSLDSVPHRRL